MNKTKNDIVIYTAIFGNRDKLQDPEFVPPNVDFVCFTDQNFTSKIWNIKKVAPPIPSDLTRSNREFKLLAHKFLPEYSYSIYIDGNIIVIDDVTELIQFYLKDANMAAFDCAMYSYLPSASVHEQAERLLSPGQEQRNGVARDEILNQLKVYEEEGFPDNNGCIMGMLLVRRHNQPDVIAAMEAWWNEVMARTKRDLLSFNYVAWKHNFKFNYIPLDGSDNKYVKKVRHYVSWYRKLAHRLRLLFI